MSLKVRTDGGVTVVKLTTDSLAEDNLLAVGEQLSRLTDGQELHLDLGDVPQVLSAGLGKLLALHRKARAAGGRLALVNVSDPLYEVTETTGLNRVLDVRRKGAG